MKRYNEDMAHAFLFISTTLLFTFLVGRMIEKVHIPWIFASLIFGIFLTFYNPFKQFTGSSEFLFLSNLGMYLLLFMVGFEIDLSTIKKQSVFFINSTVVIILLESILGGFLLKYLFGYTFFLSSIIALSFATVGEAILIPILDEFNLLHSKIGRAIIGIGTLDDVVEVVMLVIVSFIIKTGNLFHSVQIFASLGILFLLTFGLTKLKKSSHRFAFISIESLFLLTLFILFLFIGIGEFAHASSLAALLSGIAIQQFIPLKRQNVIKNEVRTMAYGLFTPFFFTWVGLSMNTSYIFTFPLLVISVVIVSSGAKLMGCYLVGRKKFGVKKSLLLGVGLSVRFSTSIIIISLLYQNYVITQQLYSVIIASSVVFTAIIPVIFSRLLYVWDKNLTS